MYLQLTWLYFLLYASFYSSFSWMLWIALNCEFSFAIQPFVFLTYCSGLCPQLFVLWILKYKVRYHITLRQSRKHINNVLKILIYSMFLYSPYHVHVIPRIPGTIWVSKTSLPMMVEQSIHDWDVNNISYELLQGLLDDIDCRGTHVGVYRKPPPPTSILHPVARCVAFTFNSTPLDVTKEAHSCR